MKWFSGLIRRSRGPFTTIAELVGLGLITKGAWDIAEPLGYIVGGVALIAVAYLVDAPPPRPNPKGSTR